MKPFDLQKALKGAPVVTRDGRKVTQLVLFDVEEDTPLFGVVHDKNCGSCIECFKENGVWRESGERSADLYMKTEKKIGYVLPDTIADTQVSDKWIKVEYEE